MSLRRLLIAGSALGLLFAGPAMAEERALASPDGRLRIVFDQQADGTPVYSVVREGQAILSPSPLTLDLDIGGELGRGMTVTNSTMREGRDAYDLIGKASRIDHPWREMSVDLTEAPTAGRPARAMRLIFRAYDDGVALRYVVPTDGGLEAVGLKTENTQFAFPADYTCWGLNLGRFNSAHEGEFDPIAASRLRDHNAYDAPLVCETAPNGPAFALAEADLHDYPALYLAGRGDGELGVQAKLAPHPDAPTLVARTRVGSPLTTPWRVIMVGDSAGDLIESTLVTDLSPAPDFDASWVKPGKSAWDWWNGGLIESVPNSGMNTATFKAFIDFAAANGLHYIMVDEGWYRGAGGGGVVRPGVDVTRTVPEIDIPELVAYGRARGVGVLLWLNWKALDAQFDDALDHYQAWGVAGIKVDFMDCDDQPMVNWFHRLLGQAAEHRLLVNLHGAFHPTGLARTYPNFLTQEGVLGAEYNKWSSRATATHNVTLPYTRMLVGPIDYTPGGFRNVTPETFQHRFLLPTVMTTRAHQLAMFVVYDSPLAVVADTPDAYAGQPEMAFISQVPTVWDETRFLSGGIGQSVVMARRSGRDWYVGAMTNEQGRTVSVPLDFLGRGRFTATSYTDGAAPTDVEIGDRPVTSTDVLILELKGSGGAAVRLTAR
ncbi:glycoside hydrolase family 97 protein [Brevundimonas sp.]|uniref:glycoside hydrolase family 97 protein n=1 Tax=Brevundimonas sp. TaxID=1871086 RepID=UPI003F702DBE